MSEERHAILQGKTVVPVDDLLEWAQWFETADRTVKRTYIDDVEVSTVFIGLNHLFDGGPPLWFETMIFGLEDEGYQTRCETWEEAEKMHKEAIDHVKRLLE